MRRTEEEYRLESIERRKGSNRKVLGFILTALGVLNSLFAMKAGVTERSWLNVALIAIGAIVFFSGLRASGWSGRGGRGNDAQGDGTGESGL